MPDRFQIDWAAIANPYFLRGDPHVAHRDPAGHYHDGRIGRILLLFCRCHRKPGPH